ncbi:uncharacterized protein LOC134721003 isoform X1 [Mytilus trossulus]|uniref:uncharacterized protein LOC134721003 isoform X1 n=2 Tax=Mytilus trossulus TaxID=6551 RepID=UPI0030078313
MVDQNCIDGIRKLVIKETEAMEISQLMNLKKFNFNYIIFIVLCAIIAYVFRAGDTYIMKPVWRKRVEPHYYSNRDYPTLDDRLPSPIITDLEGDGVNEIILISNDYKLTSLALPDKTEDEDDLTLPHVVVKNKIQLPIATKEDGGTSRPVVMSTGFTVSYQSMIQIRKQIIVIATDDWQVFCYSHDFQLLWKQRLMNIAHVRLTYKIKAMDVMITSHNVRKNDEGLVIIGGSFSHTVHDTNTTKVSNGTTLENATKEDNSLTHFSSFAISAKDGSTRWHHLPGDFGEIDTSVKDIHGDHHWKLALKRHRLHVGESPWNLYKQEIWKYLPHFWNSLEDTKIKLGRFQKQDEAIMDNQQQQKSALRPEHIMGYAYGGQRPHTDDEHIVNPNVVVIHNHNGLEVLNLLTGQPVTQFPLGSDGAIYIDIDYDGYVDRVSWGAEEGRSPCYVDIWRLQPVKEKMEGLAVCKLFRVFFSSSWAYDEDILKKLPPILIKSISRKTGILRHLLGHHLPTSKQPYDIITMGSYGRVSSYDKEGNVNWQVGTPASWSVESQDRKREVDSEPEKLQQYMDSFYPSRQLMSLQVYGHKDAMVMSGWSNIAIVDLKEGNLLASHSLPCQPSSPLVVGDFDNDGLNDIIVTCKLGYLGFSIHHHTNHIYTMLYAGMVFGAILILSWLCSPATYYSNEKEEDSDSEEDRMDDY